MTKPSITGSGGRRTAAFLVVAFVPSLLPSCASKYSQFENRNDACYAARAPLISMGTDFQKTVLGATAIGAAGGALIGVGARGDWQSALIGAAAGALAGSLVGYLDAKRRSARTEAQVLALIDQDATHDRDVVTTSTNAISNLIACRDAQINTIEASYSSHAMTREQALAAFRNLRGLMREDDKLIAELLGAADERQAKYISARADTMSLKDNPTEAASPATEQLAVVRQQAAEQQSAYRQRVASVDQHIARLETAVG